MVINIIVAAGILLGAGDTLIGDKFKIGNKFRQGFELMGAMMMSMAGIMALSPVLASLLSPVIIPLFRKAGIDPGVMGILMGSDMGGYQLAMSLTNDPKVGFLAGGITAGMLGGTLNFSIPVGFSLIEKKSVPYFSQGILIGMCAIPVGSILAALLMGMTVFTAVLNNIPVILLSVMISLGFLFIRDKMVWFMTKLGKMLSWVGVFGVGIGCFTHLTGIEVVPGMSPIMETMTTVCSVTVTMLGMFPILELFRRVFRNILNRVGGKVGLDPTSCSGIVFTMASASPVYGMMKDMDEKGVVINSAWIVCCAASLGSQMGLVLSFGTQYIGPYLTAKFASGFTALALAFFLTRNRREKVATFRREKG
jgi:ethanolamine transporter